MEIYLALRLMVVAASETLAFCDYASASPSCESVSFEEVRSLKLLPPAVRSLLDEQSIADRTQDFNKTDVENGLPTRRFSLAAVSETCVVVAVERGGRGYSVELWTYELKGGAWRSEKIGYLPVLPRSVKELVVSVPK